MSNPLVSIIVPVYNAEATIVRAIRSVENQSYVNWELILVDDGSMDNSSHICSEYANSSSRIKYISKKNSGPADTRNMGIEMANGKYLAFLDSDDEYAPNFLSTMVQSSVANDTDITMCAFAKIIDNKTKIPVVHKLPINKKLVGQESANHLLKDLLYKPYGGTAALWNKLYNRDYIYNNHLRLESTRIHGEDWKFNIDLYSTTPPVSSS
jgi:glycosyltransferase involved in cell wall biosynthesis